MRRTVVAPRAGETRRPIALKRLTFGLLFGVAIGLSLSAWADGDSPGKGTYETFLQQLQMAQLQETLGFSAPQVAQTEDPPEVEPASETKIIEDKGVEITVIDAPGPDKPAKGKAWLPESGDAYEKLVSPESQLSREMREKLELLRTQRVTVTLKEADLQNVVRLLARQGGLNVVMNPSLVQDTVTTYLEDVPILRALDSLLKAHDLAYIVEEGNILRIVPLSKVEPEQKAVYNTVHLPLNWIRADSLKTVLEPILTEAKGKITAEPLSNSVVISATPPTIDRIRNIVRNLDVPDRQVDIEARFVELSEDASRDLGTAYDLYTVDGNLQSPDQRTLRVPAIDPVSGNRIGNDRATRLPVWTDVADVAVDSFGMNPGNLANPTGSGGVWQWGTTGRFLGQDWNLALRIDAFEDRGDAETLANPRVTTLNNIPATIDLTTEIPYEIVTNDPGGQVTVVAAFKPVGIKMTVTPTITSNGYVRMNIVADQMILERLEQLPRVGNVPVISYRRSETNVIVEDEETAALFGLRQLEASKSITGVPWMHRIPFFGWLFKSQNDDQRKVDLAVFVTPHVLKEPNITDEQQQKYDRIDMRWHLPDYFFDDASVTASEYTD